jgi:hypothetical protein
MFTVRGEELGTVLVPRLEQRLEDLAGERKDLVKIDERMLDGDSAVGNGLGGYHYFGEKGARPK